MVLDRVEECTLGICLLSDHADTSIIVSPLSPQPTPRCWQLNPIHPSIHPSIHPFIHPLSTAYPKSGHGGSSFSSQPQTSLSPVTSANSDCGIPRCSQAREESTPRSPPRNTPERARNTSRLYPQSHSFGHDPSLMTIGEGRDED